MIVSIARMGDMDANSYALLRVNEEISSLYSLDGHLTTEQLERLADLQEQRRQLEEILGDSVQGLKGYRGGPA
jgi:hypothetical protein